MLRTTSGSYAKTLSFRKQFAHVGGLYNCLRGHSDVDGASGRQQRPELCVKCRHKDLFLLEVGSCTEKYRHLESMLSSERPEVVDEGFSLEAAWAMGSLPQVMMQPTQNHIFSARRTRSSRASFFACFLQPARPLFKPCASRWPLKSPCVLACFHALPQMLGLQMTGKLLQGSSNYGYCDFGVLNLACLVF